MKLAFAKPNREIRRDTTLDEVRVDQQSRSGLGIAKPRNDREKAIYDQQVSERTKACMDRIRTELKETGEAAVSAHTTLIDTAWKGE